MAEAAAAWLGRSPFRPGETVAAAPAVALPEVPARYGFHATLRAPFRLAHGTTERDLLRHFAQFAAARPPLRPVLSIAPLSRFLAFRSADRAIDKAARATMEAFDRMRAPLSDAERARRQVDRLDGRELELLNRWGYPYVMDRYVFHMTLSGPLDAGGLTEVTAAARAHFGPLDGAPHPLIHAVYREDEPGRPFTVIATQDAVDDDKPDPAH
ncbi:DUF1045 domain-containing protein [Acuticoccus sp. I52.16.1]|uniref:DUF1045 domain-containing protein n=1 Tax=Acuticoccus sp. I52.16.1 TaxID=2928472 RepID=UPI001FD2786C|nr:DUF1045 domain-containing protein [Acuticoccus sp. I52.16.1]UOM35871.1 DUF1045 domain-containing protein [Acuticoccus sp. I52.16.1]